MILTGAEIHRQHRAKRITIEPFAESQISPSSYNYRLGPTLRVHDSATIDPPGRLRV
jgi:deoxycytidine triphosphate deaminase